MTALPTSKASTPRPGPAGTPRSGDTHTPSTFPAAAPSEVAADDVLEALDNQALAKGGDLLHALVPPPAAVHEKRTGDGALDDTEKPATPRSTPPSNPSLTGTTATKSKTVRVNKEKPRKSAGLKKKTPSSKSNESLRALQERRAARRKCQPNPLDRDHWLFNWMRACTGTKKTVASPSPSATATPDAKETEAGTTTRKKQVLQLLETARDRLGARRKRVRLPFKKAFRVLLSCARYRTLLEVPVFFGHAYNMRKRVYTSRRVDSTAQEPELPIDHAGFCDKVATVESFAATPATSHQPAAKVVGAGANGFLVTCPRFGHKRVLKLVHLSEDELTEVRNKVERGNEKQVLGNEFGDGFVRLVKNLKDPDSNFGGPSKSLLRGISIPENFDIVKEYGFVTIFPRGEFSVNDLLDANAGKLDPIVSDTILAQMLKGLLYVNIDKKLLLMDIKPANVVKFQVRINPNTLEPADETMTDAISLPMFAFVDIDSLSSIDGKVSKPLLAGTPLFAELQECNCCCSAIPVQTKHTSFDLFSYTSTAFAVHPDVDMFTNRKAVNRQRRLIRFKKALKSSSSTSPAKDLLKRLVDYQQRLSPPSPQPAGSLAQPELGPTGGILSKIFFDKGLAEDINGKTRTMDNLLANMDPFLREQLEPAKDRFFTFHQDNPEGYTVKTGEVEKQMNQINSARTEFKSESQARSWVEQVMNLITNHWAAADKDASKVGCCRLGSEAHLKRKIERSFLSELEGGNPDLMWLGDHFLEKRCGEAAAVKAREALEICESGHAEFSRLKNNVQKAEQALQQAVDLKVIYDIYKTLPVLKPIKIPDKECTDFLCECWTRVMEWWARVMEYRDSCVEGVRRIRRGLVRCVLNR